MNSHVELGLRLPRYQAARRFGFAPPPPLSLALCVTHRCNCDCLMCNIGSRAVDELDIDDWTRVFAAVGDSVPWITMTGGEPFIRDDFPALMDAMLRTCKPGFVVVPTNGLFSDGVLEFLRVCESHAGVSVTLNFSLDGPRRLHDIIRGTPGAFERMAETWQRTRRVRPSNVLMGLHSTVSKHNAGAAPELVRTGASFEPDNHFFEVAQPRAELGMDGCDVAPESEELKDALLVIRKAAAAGWDTRRGLVGLATALRREYYRCVERVCINGGRMPVCHAGIASGYVEPDGALKACPNRSEPIGNLLDSGLKKLWNSSPATRERKQISKSGCRCLLANTAYTNLLLEPASVIRAALGAFA